MLQKEVKILMIKFQKSIALVILFLSIAMVYGCAKPPTKELTDAQNAISAAEQAGAADYAAAELDAAKQALIEAQALIDQKKYKEAQAALPGVAEKANAAASAAATNKETMKAEVAANVPNIEQALADAKAALEDANKKKVPADKIQMASDDIAAAESAIAQAKTDLDAGTVKAASDALAPLAEKLSGAKMTIQDAIAAMKPAKGKKK